MGFQNREIEVKLETTESLSSVLERLTPIFTDLIAKDSSTDFYWPILNRDNAFSRLRVLGKGHMEMTIKQEDRGNCFNRIEVDLEVRTDFVTALRYQKLLLGEPIGHIYKTYWIWKIGSSGYDTLSCYTVSVNGVEQNKVFVEIEGTSQRSVLAKVKKLKKLLPDLKETNASLYTMFLKR